MPLPCDMLLGEPDMKAAIPLAVSLDHVRQKYFPWPREAAVEIPYFICSPPKMRSSNNRIYFFYVSISSSYIGSS